ncbi:hypothetical protein B0189_06815 [Moraxella cuniculi]|nr:hypothetical protein B0189_06815 [Moraxella cuniculi]
MIKSSLIISTSLQLPPLTQVGGGNLQGDSCSCCLDLFIIKNLFDGVKYCKTTITQIKTAQNKNPPASLSLADFIFLTKIIIFFSNSTCKILI